MQRILLYLSFIALAVTSFAQSADYENLIAERAKTGVVVKYIIELEENRTERTVTGIVVSKDGLIMLPRRSVSFYLRPESLKDFRVFFKDGDSDGYQADFLGNNREWGCSYIKLRKGLPASLRPVTDFPSADVKVGQTVWGILLTDDIDFTPVFYKTYVTIKNLSENNEMLTDRPVAGNGLGAFDDSGNFVGWGQSSAFDGYTLYLRNGDRIPVELCDELVTRTILPPENFAEASKAVPMLKTGDKSGWVGVADVQVVKKEAAKFLGIEKIGAIVIGRVFDDSPAQKAGLKRGDIIVSLNGVDLPRMKSDNYTLSSFIKKMVRVKPQENVKFGILRDNKTESIEIKTNVTPREFPESKFKYFKRLGFSVREFILDDSISRKMQKPIIDTAVVQFVKANSPASSAQPNGLASSEIIREINSKPITSYNQAVEILEKINADKAVKDLVILAEDYKETKLLRIKLD